MSQLTGNEVLRIPAPLQLVLFPSYVWEYLALYILA